MSQLRALLALVLLILASATLRTQQQPPPSLEVHFIDVGQGDGVLIQSPSGQNVLYDAGEQPTRVRDYLVGLGITQLGLVIASHNHADHIGGIAEVVRHYRPQFYMDNGVPATTQTYARTLEAVSAVGSELLEPTPRQITLGDASLTVVPPPGIPDWDQNDNSIGIVIRYGEFYLTLAGDAEQREWAWWLIHHRPSFREVHVHKASHHGSNNGDIRDGLAVLSPERISIGVGGGNVYGHPDAEALRLYGEIGATVLRTDKNGTIVVDAQPTGAYTVRVEKGEQVAPPAPPPSPTPSPVPSGSWTDPLPRRSSGSHPVCQTTLPAVAACVNNITGPPQVICNDRAFSCSTGSGTCSGHGGVYCWRN